eukprot:365832-Chlamydomonas_euryale.AAC.17
MTQTQCQLHVAGQPHAHSPEAVVAVRQLAVLHLAGPLLALTTPGPLSPPYHPLPAHRAHSPEAVVAVRQLAVVHLAGPLPALTTPGPLSPPYHPLPAHRAHSPEAVVIVWQLAVVHLAGLGRAGQLGAHDQGQRQQTG